MFHLKAYKIKGINSKQLLPVWFSEFFSAMLRISASILEKLY